MPIPPRYGGAEYCTERVCLWVCVCLSWNISLEPHDQTLPSFMRATYSGMLILDLGLGFEAWVLAFNILALR